MARTKQTARRSTGGKAPRLKVAPPSDRQFGSTTKDDEKKKELKQKIEALSLSELKDTLTAFNLPTSGLRKALQLRITQHMTKNNMEELPNKVTPPTKAKVATRAKKPKKIIDDISSSESEDEEMSPIGEPEAQVDEEEEEEEEEDEEEVVWQWADDSTKGSQDLWRDYSATLQSKLNKAYQNKQKKVRVDTQRFVDLSSSPFLQCRYDDPSRRRLVQRLVKPTKKKKAPTKATKVTKQSKKEEKEEESDEDIVLDLEDSSEKEEEEEEEEQIVAEWMWAGDSPNGGHQDIWVPYSKKLCALIEAAWSKGEKEVKVDEERFVDLQNMLQRRFDDKMKRRSVKRKVNHVTKTTTVKSPKKVAKKAIEATVSKKGGKLVIGTKAYQKKKLQQSGVEIVSDEEDTEKTTTGKRKRIEEDSDSEDEKPKKKKQKTKEEDFSLAKQLNLPSTWGAHATMDIKEVVIPTSSQEFQMVSKMMSSTIAGYHKNNTGNHPVRFTKLEVSRVVRIQNPVLWIRYSHRKAAMVQEYASTPTVDIGTVLTGPSTDAVANEYFLFHGLNENAIPGIARFGFDPKYCSLKGMFGAALYFAENSSKANQYCHGGSCTASGFLTGRAQCRCKKSEEACIMLCRVALGDPFIEKKYRGNKDGDYWFGRRKEVEKTKRGQTGVYNSVIGESQHNGGDTLLLREYVVYDSAQVYPEYIVYYHRK